MESFSHLDFNEPGELPPVIKAILMVSLCVIIWGAGFYFSIKDKNMQLESLEQKEVQLRQTFEKKQQKAVNLEAYKAQLAEMKVVFSSMLDQLPKKSEVPELLVDITRTGLINGLVFQVFQPQSELPRDFYAELPVNMTVTGTYHQFAKFLEGLSQLPRIVTIHDTKIAPVNSGPEKMTMKLQAKTYRYFDGSDK